MLEIKNLCKKYGAFEALNGVSIDIDPGIYGVLGPNGAGKSTFMNLLTCSIQRTSGSILFGGREILEQQKKYFSHLGYMPQSGGYYPHFTVRQFLYYMGYMKGMKRNQVQERAVNLLMEMNLLDKFDVEIRRLSGGMKRRIMLVNALLADPDILILDEPTAGVDPQERTAIRNYISRYSSGKVILIATHIVSDIEAIANYVVFLKKGRIEMMGEPSRLVEMLDGKVYETWATYENLSELQDKYIISNISAEKKGLLVKLLAKDSIQDDGFFPGNASLTDVYLSTYRKDNEPVNRHSEK